MTSIGGQASLKCFVESFPKAITYWTKKSNHPEYFDRLIEKRLVSLLNIHPLIMKSTQCYKNQSEYFN